MSDLIIRFVIGGVVVTAFAMIGDLFKPKSFAGLFGAAPSVALGSLALTLRQQPQAYTALEARSMLAGAAGLLVYCMLITWLLKRDHLRATAAASSGLVAWFVVALGLWYLFIR